MRKYLLSALSVAFAFSGFSQSSPIGKLSTSQQNQHVEIPVELVINQNPVPAKDFGINPPTIKRNATEVEIGETKYDLQSNSAIQWRLINHENGTLSASWTYSNSNSWATRGTGYNYFNGTTWGTAPTSEIETVRTGWPSMISTTNGSELFIAHNTADDVLRMSKRGSVGSGTWVQENLDTLSGQVWNRATSTGNYVHMVAMTLPDALGGSSYGGMDGAFLYSRSSNAGASWDIVDYQIPGTDSSYFDGFDGDSYAIDADGDNVAIAVAGLGRGVQLFKSTNAGQNWTKTDVLLSDIWFTEASTFVDTSLADRLYTSDGNVAVLLDDNGDAHVWFGAMYIANADLTDGLISYYPGTNSIDYWNENFDGPTPISLAGALDVDGDGQLSLLGANVGDVTGQYRFSGLASMPHAGIASDGCMYLAYSAIREDLDNFSQHYRHTYVMSSCDYGCSWSFPIDVTGASSNNFAECVYASMARNVDDDIHMIYMSDEEPGIAVSGDEDAVDDNSIIYLKEDRDRFDTAQFCPVEIFGDSVLCLGGSAELYVVGCANAYSWAGPSSFTATTASISATETGTYTVTVTTDCGSQVLTVGVDAYTGTGGPAVNVTASVQSMCAGDTSVLTANTSVGGLSYLWSTGSNDSAIVVTSPGTYTVTVSDCNGGTTTVSHTISQPTTPPSAVITGDLSICPGASTQLVVLPVTGGTYVWSTGSTSSTTTVSAAGTYTCTVTNCGGTSTGSVTVTQEALPTAAINPSALEACDGDQITLTASGGANFEWDGGETSTSITVTATGTYTVTVSNDCGDEDITDVSVTFHDLPAAPSITESGTTYTSSQTGAGTHTWYVDGVVQGGTGSSITAPGPADWYGKTISATYTDENGCTSPEGSTVGIEDVAGVAMGLSVYPNPNNGQFEINFGDFTGVSTVEITNTLSQVVYSSTVNTNANQVESFDLSNLETGVYNISISNDAQRVIESIIIK